MNGSITASASVLPVDTGSITTGLIVRTLGLICVYYVVRFFYKLYVVRSRAKSLTKDYGIVC